MKTINTYFSSKDKIETVYMNPSILKHSIKI